jgi:hypothetical protein
MRERHPAPVQRLHMHRPERLRRLAPLVPRQLERSACPYRKPNPASKPARIG